MDKRFENFNHFFCFKTFESLIRWDLYRSSADRELRFAPVKSRIIEVVDNFMLEVVNNGSLRLSLCHGDCVTVFYPWSTMSGEIKKLCPIVQ